VRARPTDAHIRLLRIPADVTFCVARYVKICLMVLSLTNRRSILLIRSERRISAVLMAAIVCRNVLTFDPNDTIPPSTTAIDPRATT
jgi:phosphatidylserine decarboxylase